MGELENVHHCTIASMERQYLVLVLQGLEHRVRDGEVIVSARSLLRETQYSLVFPH